ncbi:MAG: helix-turn-helix domain-containing protein [Nostoc sp. ChiSLP02]|nr:helix-turn-helix domain-containing protein [Nostoc sp. DedSLP05]MDZ8099307.1 helix-turn-helix domain-containing protein [Nostoc sp. DedSLP01]MDZ8188427.1 helix-turn-helix domain-containing protein [Nostoc sp. ChiSLP02]
MMPSALRIILTTEEDLTLFELSCADKVPHRTKLRAIALRLNAHGWNVPQIPKYLGWAQQTVRQTIKRWQFQGLGGLWEAPGRGKKRTWHEVDWQVVEECLEQNRRYSARQLSQKLFEERQIELGAEQIRRLLKKRGGIGNVVATVRL